MNIPAATPSTAGHGVLPSFLPPDRRGRLRNGARPGDFLAAPRCGARTRSGGCCRQPAMKSPRGGGGRCRLHGGLSTGPRTAEGRARCAAARTIHGGYSAAVRALQAECRTAIQRMRTLRLRLRATAGHGVLRSEIRSQKPEAGSRQPHLRPSNPVAARSSTRQSVPLGSDFCILASASTAGHGVLPRRPSLMQRLLLGSTAIGVSVRHPVSAGHGVLPSISAAAG